MHTWQTLLAMLQTWFCSIAHVVYIVACSTVVCVVVQNVLVLIASCANVVCAAVRAFFFCNNLPSLFAHVLFLQLCNLLFRNFANLCWIFFWKLVLHMRKLLRFLCVAYMQHDFATLQAWSWHLQKLSLHLCKHLVFFYNATLIRQMIHIFAILLSTNVTRLHIGLAYVQVWCANLFYVGNKLTHMYVQTPHLGLQLYRLFFGCKSRCVCGFAKCTLG